MKLKKKIYLYCFSIKINKNIDKMCLIIGQQQHNQKENKTKTTNTYNPVGFFHIKTT
jgi:hypothetical protein